MRAKRVVEPVSSTVYDTDYLLSPALEGYDDYLAGSLSLVKRHELDLLAAGPGDRVLDLGCGRGEVVAELLGRGIDATGVDYAAAAVALSAELAAGRGLVVQADALALPFPTGCFDRVLLGDVIEHLPWPMAVRAMVEVGRVLAPGGRALVHTAPNRWFVGIVMPLLRPVVGRLGHSQVAERLADYDHLRGVMHPNELSPLGLRRLLARAGLPARTWVDRDVLRSGASAWTSGLAASRAVRAIGAVAGCWPLRLLTGNDLYALVGERSRRPAAQSRARAASRTT